MTLVLVFFLLRLWGRLKSQLGYYIRNQFFEVVTIEITYMEAVEMIFGLLVDQSF
jgi:hypothetical protein